MERTILVKAGAVGPVVLPEPIDGQRVIADEPVAVVETRFIRRRLAVGDLIEVPAPVAATKPARAGQEG